ncbi:ABC protein [Mycena venus]|uniref:ABC protein n=1 Tax=Mycena venus TaxID=2733690 RepID=A0A8H7CS69_9AGAR|nr:ABC protein [Mycena venus]
MDASLCPHCGAEWLTGPPVEAFDLHVASGTRHYALLNGNTPPEDSETTFIHSIVSDADARLACIDDEISKLQKRVKQLKEKRALVSSYRTQNNGILSPLRRMPPEVLGEIFLWTLPTSTEKLERSKFYLADSPWVLTHICSRWRAISVSIPSLWSLIIIDYCAQPHPTYPLSLVEVQIQRAQNLKIHFYGGETNDSRPQIETFQFLSQHSSRWEDLSLGLTSKLVPFLPALRGRIQSLKRLWIQWSSPESQTVTEAIDCFESAPALVDFAVFNEYSFVPIAHPTHQLTRYELDCPWAEHRRILKLAPNLVEVRVVIRFDSEPWPDVDAVINLPYLRRLYVSSSDALNYLRAPALEGLSLWVDVDTLLPHLESFRDRSACSLRRLSLKGFPNAYTTTKILEQLPSITELAIAIDNSDASEGADLIMSALTVSHTPGSTVVAPHLRFLLLGCELDGSVDYTAYLEMLKSRWTAENCALNAATLAAEGPGPDSATLHGLHALRREGLDLFLVAGWKAVDEIEGWVYSTTWYH